VQFQPADRAPATSRWGSSACGWRDLAGRLPTGCQSPTWPNDVQFTWTREARTFRFTEQIVRIRAAAAAPTRSRQDQTFVNKHGRRRLQEPHRDDIVRLAVIDVTIAHVRGLAQAGYPNLSIDDVVRTRIHRVTPEFVRDLAAVGYKNISPSTISFAWPSTGRHRRTSRRFRMPAIRAQSVEDLIRFRIHKVTPEFIKAIEARGYKNVPAEDLVKMRIHKVSPEEMDQLKALGFGGMGIDDLVKFRIHRVTPEFIKSMKDLGFVTILRGPTGAVPDPQGRCAVHPRRACRWLCAADAGRRRGSRDPRPAMETQRLLTQKVFFVSRCASTSFRSRQIGRISLRDISLIWSSTWGEPFFDQLP
jgi:hypothetical protein